MSSPALGRTSLVKHSIDTGCAPPIKQPLRRMPLAHQEIVSDEIDRLLEHGLIEKSHSPWASPIVLAKKKDGTPRLCIDLKKVNEITRKDSYPLPNIQECLDSMSGSCWFGSLDIASGFHQVEMVEADKAKTAFITKKGLFQWKVMPFGLCNAPATFERLMERVLEGLQWEICNLFIDDVVAYAPTEDVLIDRLATIFARLRGANLKLKPKKCHLFKRQLVFLGHVVSKDGVACDPEKLSAVADWPTPECLTDVRAFLGLTGYYRSYVPDYASLATPLTKLTEKDQPFELKLVRRPLRP